MKNLIVTISFLTVLICNNLHAQQEFHVLKGPFLGQKLPGMTPEIFAAELNIDLCTVFSPDGNEFYTSLYDEEKDAATILCMKKKDNTWSKAKPLHFSGLYGDNDITISPDGNKLFFLSDRPFVGHNQKNKRSYIWYVNRTRTGWSEPTQIKFSGENIPTGYPSVTNNGTLYFSARLKDLKGPTDIYRSRLVNGEYTKPENIGSNVNTDYTEGDLYVAPDESYLIVSCYSHPNNIGNKGGDLYISFKNKNNEWTCLTNLGKLINTENNEHCPTVSPDGKFLFFRRFNNTTYKWQNYWVSTKFLKKLKPIESK